jgi:two-component system KDP operon response regulator KdpE
MLKPLGSGPRPALILLVEDADFNSRAARMTLESNGYDVIDAGEGAEALVLAKLHTPDLVVLDLGLPDVNGLTVASDLKADETTREIPILVCSADDRAETIAACMNAGCSEYLLKPFSADDLLGAVERTLLKSGVDPGGPGHAA